MTQLNSRPTVAAMMVLLLMSLLLTADAVRVAQHVSTATVVATSTPTDRVTAAHTLTGRALLAKKKKSGKKYDWQKWLDISVKVDKGDKSGSVKVGPVDINWGPK